MSLVYIQKTEILGELMSLLRRALHNCQQVINHVVLID